MREPPHRILHRALHDFGGLGKRHVEPLYVQQALGRSALVPDGSDVTSDTKDGIITLTGHVRSWAEHDAVVGAARMALGVIDVRDELQVTV